MASGQVLTLFGVVLSIKLLTNLIGPEGYGQLALGLSIAGALAMIVFGPLNQSVLRFYSIYKNKDRLNEYIAFTKSIHIYITIIILPITIFFSYLVGYYLGNLWGWVTFLSLLFGVSSGLVGNVLAYYSAKRKRKYVALVQSLDVWLRVFFAVLAILFISKTGASAILGYLIGSIFIFTFQLILYGIKEKHEYENKNITGNHKKFIEYAKPFLFFALIAIFGTYFDRWVLQGLFGEREVGAYVALYQIANAPILLLVSIINQYMVPILFQKAKHGENIAECPECKRILNNTVKGLSVLLLGMIILMYVFSYELVLVVTSTEFIPYIDMLWVIALSISVFSIGQVLVLRGQYANQPGIYIIPKIIHSIAAVVLTYIFGVLIGVMGVAIGMMLSSICYLVSVIVVNKSLDRSTVKI